MAANPMTQFEVYRIGPEIKINQIDISFTNASLFMIISALSILLIFNLGSSKKNIIPTKIQLLAELSYSFISKMISDTAGNKGKPYFNLIFSLFMFVLFCNMFGMLPYSFYCNEPYNRNFFSCSINFYWGHCYWVYKTWLWIFKTVCAEWSPFSSFAINSSY